MTIVGYNVTVVGGKSVVTSDPPSVYIHVAIEAQGVVLKKLVDIDTHNLQNASL